MKKRSKKEQTEYVKHVIETNLLVIKLAEDILKIIKKGTKDIDKVARWQVIGRVLNVLISVIYQPVVWKEEE